MVCLVCDLVCMSVLDNQFSFVIADGGVLDLFELSYHC